ncbi:hypothetical protein F0562_035773 [Nyssa sinensis]|uniref:50S ribosomal protein 6, chloroplastic n=1 Tax=Nyssa sinensis TaxID=561372 RepID=A0A5J5AE09_9ASTE|nr:hypothetical protein F0562_035773 [Nyssa sinensis]
MGGLSIDNVRNPIERRKESHSIIALKSRSEEENKSTQAILFPKNMSVSAIFGSRMVVMPSFSSFSSAGIGGVGGATKPAPRLCGGGGGGLVIECSSRPQKKGTKHHMKTRPRKTQLWDIKRGPTVYPPLPALPPDWTLVTDDVVEAALSPPPPEPLKSDVCFIFTNDEMNCN